MAHDAFYQMISAATERPVIFAYENGPRPPRPFISMQLTVGQPQPVHYGPVDQDGNRKISATRPVSVLLQCYGDGSWGILDRLQLALHRDDILNLAESLNISILREPRLQDVPALLDGTTYESRAVLDIDAMYTGSIDEQVGLIDTVHGEMNTAPGAIPIQEFTVTAP